MVSHAARRCLKPSGASEDTEGAHRVWHHAQACFLTCNARDGPRSQAAAGRLCLQIPSE